MKITITLVVLTAAAVTGLTAMPGSVELRGQAPAQGAEKPAFERAPDALERVSWRTRTLVGDDRLTQWKFGISAGALGGLTFLEAVVRADAAGVEFIEGSSTQKVSAEIPKNFDHTLTAEEIATIRGRMGNVRMPAYWVETLDRKAFAFAKAMGVDTIVARSETAAPHNYALADEFDIKVAFRGHAVPPVRLLKELEGRPMRLGVSIDTGQLAQEGVPPHDALAAIKDRLLHLNLRDRSGPGASARNVMLGRGTGKLTELFHELNRLKLRPLVMTLDTTGVVNAPADLFKAVDAFEEVVQPAYGVYFTEFSRSRPIRWDLVTPGRGETLAPDAIRKRTEEVRQKIDAAIPRQAYARPQKARKLLVVESLHGMSHNTIPHANVMIEEMGKITGAWTTAFDNDLTNLKYPKIKEYDAIFLNSIVGEFAADPDVRESLSRFVREGGGLGGVHGTPWASRNWDEFAEMIGAQSAPHRIEQGVMKVYDAASPIMKPFGGKDLNFREEYYRFEHNGRGRLRWDKVRVLMTVALDDPKIEPRPWTGYKRPDNIYPVTWIRSYGKGRVFYSSLGHMEETFMTPEIVGHFLAGVQFMLGDLEADTTPNPRPAASRSQ